MRTPMDRTMRLFVGSVVLMLAAGAASARADEIIDLHFGYQVLNFSGSGAPTNVLFMGLGTNAFSDPSSPANLVEVRAPVSNGSSPFSASATSGGGGARSFGFDTPAALNDAINAPGDWTLTFHDGALDTTFAYVFTVTGSAITGDHLRPLAFTNTLPGSVIDVRPTIDWSLANAIDPGNEYTGGYMGYSSPGGSSGGRFLTPDERSFTPTEDLVPGVYGFVLRFNGPELPVSIVNVSPLVAVDGGPPLTLALSVAASSYANLAGLTVIPGPGPIALLALAGFAAIRRR